MQSIPFDLKRICHQALPRSECQRLYIEGNKLHLIILPRFPSQIMLCGYYIITLNGEKKHSNNSTVSVRFFLFFFSALVLRKRIIKITDLGFQIEKPEIYGCSLNRKSRFTANKPLYVTGINL